MKITIIGCGTPTPVPEAFGTAHVVEAAGQKLLFDCGPGTTHKLVRVGISPTAIDNVFFSHHHFDHNADFPAFLLVRWDQNVPTDRVLNVYGSRQTDEFVRGIIDEDRGLFRYDWLARVHHRAGHATYSRRGGVLPRKQPMVQVRELEPGDVVEGDGWRVTATHAPHVQPWLHSLAFRVDAEGRSVVLTGDTRVDDAITELARGADVLMMMCWEADDHMNHTGRERASASIKDCAETATAAGVRTLVLVHLGQRLRVPEMLEPRQEEAEAYFDGTIIFGEEMMEVPLPD